MEDTELLSMIALKNHTTPDEVCKEMQSVIDAMWEGMDQQDDNPEQKALFEFFDGEKPSVTEFIEYCTGLVDSERGIKL